jgi:mannose-6-phosphate isomerase-like protein (cupin superfamily)
MKNKSDYIPGEEFHTKIKRVYSGDYSWAVNKKKDQMAHVVYEAVHENRAFQDERRGHGKDYAIWIFSEEEGIREGVFSSCFELLIDAELEPNASIGLHHHHRTEEIYYILKGSIRMTTVGSEGEEHTEELAAGDAHAVRSGQAHYGTAGQKGVRFLAVAFRTKHAGSRHDCPA